MRRDLRKTDKDRWIQVRKVIQVQDKANYKLYEKTRTLLESTSTELNFKYICKCIANVFNEEKRNQRGIWEKHGQGVVRGKGSVGHPKFPRCHKMGQNFK